MTQRTPSLQLPPLQRRPSLPGPQPGQESRPPLSYPMTWIVCVPRPIAHLYRGEGGMSRDAGEEVERWLSRVELR